MKNNQNFIFVIVILFLTEKVQLWEYSEKDEWAELYPGCDGQNQSPIDLNSKTWLRDRLISIVHFHEYDLEFDLSSTQLVNDGHTVVLTGKTITNVVPYIRNHIFLTKYMFHSLHFHWGSTDDVGSEHRVDGTQYSMELHLVHVNENYATLEEAEGNRDGLTVLGIFFDISTEKSPLTAIVEHLNEVVDSESSAQLTTSFSLNSLIRGLNTKKFFRYDGSLTTPNCSESVAWTVFREPLPITEDELSKFRKLLDANQNPIVDNFRDPQPVGSRTVLYRTPLLDF